MVTQKRRIMDFCPVELTLKIIKNQWTVLILKEFFKHNSLTFNEILNNIDFLSKKMLSENLKKLSKYGIVSKTINNKKNIYKLTNIGNTLEPVLSKMDEWGTNYNKNLLKNKSTNTKSI